MSKQRLGRGLDSLLGDDFEESAPEGETEVKWVPVDMIRPGTYQPRKQMNDEALRELAESIRTQGIVQPLVVRRREESGDYELIAGERRWRAAQLAGLENVPAMVRSLADGQALEIALIENIQREELTPVEEARAFERLVEEFDLTHEAIAERVGRNRATISNTLRLLRLPDPVHHALEEGTLRMGHARALLSLEGHERLGEVANEVVQKGLSVRATEDRVRKVAKEAEATSEESERTSGGVRKDPDIERLEQALGEQLGTKVRITQRKNRGKLEISYSSLEELESIIQRIQQESQD
ncbi:ParB/RepB/Spo0J family partition protein [Thiohalorhabdus sp. Cl-TMA]|uniref:Probable chromosome-partitioning protein ParB n=1 Tax=Thiohalorhabdus methylotrophus TaxID=3242694 RepID=A0ABV4TPI3_9GAMM